MNRRRKGNDWEHVVRDYLEQHGWFVVPQKASAFPDIMAAMPENMSSVFLQKEDGATVRRSVRCRRFWLFECKSDGNMSEADRADLLMLAEKLNAGAAVAYPQFGPRSERTDNVLMSILREE